MISLRTNYIFTAIIVFTVAVIFTGCSFQDENRKDVIARVGDNYLTVDEVTKNLPSYLSDKEKSDFGEKFVENWVINQILYQNAVQEGTVLSDQQKNELKKLHDSYIIRNFLDVKLASSAGAVTKEQIEKYYQKHQTDYLFTKPAYHLVQLMLEERNKEIFREIKNSKNLLSVLKKYRLISRPGEPMVNGDIGFVEVSSLNPRIARALRYKKIGEVTSPIKIEGKYFFLQLLEKKNPGDPKPLSLVEDEIRTLVEIQSRDALKEKLIKKLRTMYVIETFLSKLKNEVIN
jgi:hypothetical protein